jgi:hypothetical protein
MHFGNYAVVLPYTHNFEKEPDWYWKFNPPTAKDELDLQRFLFQRRTRTVNGVAEQLPATSMEVVFHQLALTFGGTNVPKYEQDEDGKWVKTDSPVLKKGAETEDVKKVLGEMPTDLVMELWVALGEHIPNWGPIQDDPKG